MFKPGGNCVFCQIEVSGVPRSLAIDDLIVFPDFRVTDANSVGGERGSRRTGLQANRNRSKRLKSRSHHVPSGLKGLSDKANSSGIKRLFTLWLP